MGKHIITSFDSSGRPFTSESTLHLQQAFQEQIASTLIGIIESIYGTGNYDPTKVYIINGCIDTLGSGNHNISAGSVFFNGEVYQSDAQVFAITANPVVANLSTTFYVGVNPDPIVYKDLSSHSPHQILKIIYTTGISGTGTFNGSASVNNDLLSFVNIFTYFISTGLAFGAGCTNFGTPYYNVGYKIKGNEIELCGVIAATALGSTATILTLPSNIRPSSQTDLFINTQGFGSFNIIKIKTDGTIVFNSGGGASGNIYLDNITYRLN